MATEEELTRERIEARKEMYRLEDIEKSEEKKKQLQQSISEMKRKTWEMKHKKTTKVIGAVRNVFSRGVEAIREGQRGTPRRKTKTKTKIVYVVRRSKKKKPQKKTRIVYVERPKKKIVRVRRKQQRTSGFGFRVNPNLFR